ncbi:hypothetical protein MYCTH_2295741 [Thermothelomyces thermophilus ATCC 42464]|uniref:DUF7053 domain-containing protein n=1 Tax=Thermothelomyces thermophilus (strain ATCC 42464 / BCRC 31852 / DSM 1799) TaxID=573729 RepID=G2Q691_THET4|nr:uncharacterized protein MYCTH_2295741 [Thermothelomyces thermophilus ATCC 42464]AEO53861.1 hypothetical protein MYCTH_2295741 [Thermothelomyces thermophilus ATCC 42464]
MLSDHEFFLSCDPHLDKYQLIPPSDHVSLGPPRAIPDHVRSRLRPRSQCPPSEGFDTAAGKDEAEGTKEEGEEEPVPVCYRVTDIVHAVPAGIWDTRVVSTYEFTDTQDGLFVRIRSPLSIVMDTVWEVREAAAQAGEAAGLELVEDVTIQCSRLLVGIVKGQCENGWGKIHAKMIARLEGEIEKGS